MQNTGTKYLQIAAYVLITAIFVLLMGVARNCSNIHTITDSDGHSEGDTLDIAIIYGPESYYLYDDTIGGINYELEQYFISQTDLPAVVWPVTDPATALAKLQEGAFDIVASLPLDNALKVKFPVSENVFLDRLVLLQRIDSITGEKSVNSSLDLNGKSVSVAAGSSAAQRLYNMSEENGGKIGVVEEPELSDELIALKVANGSIPYAMVNERVAENIAEKYPDLRYDSSVSFTQFQVWVFNPADSLVAEKFNNWFNTFKETQTYQEIINRY